MEHLNPNEGLDYRDMPSHRRLPSRNSPRLSNRLKARMSTQQANLPQKRPLFWDDGLLCGPLPVRESESRAWSKPHSHGFNGHVPDTGEYLQTDLFQGRCAMTNENGAFFFFFAVRKILIPHANLGFDIDRANLSFHRLNSPRGRTPRKQKARTCP